MPQRVTIGRFIRGHGANRQTIEPGMLCNFSDAEIAELEKLDPPVIRKAADNPPQVMIARPVATTIAEPVEEPPVVSAAAKRALAIAERQARADEAAARAEAAEEEAAAAKAAVEDADEL
jgi:hypothetical protein